MTSTAFEPALSPDGLARFFVARANAGDVDGLVALYQADAVLACPDGTTAAGSDAIRAFYAKLLAGRPRFTLGEQRSALCCGDLALTSTRLANGAVTAEIARRQADGTWLWVVDQPAITA